MSMRRSSLTLILSFTSALALSNVGCAGASEQGGAQSAAGGDNGEMAKVGAPAPDFAAEPIAGDGPKTLKDASGKVVLVDFWATFCDPCKKSFPAYQKLVDQFSGD